MRPFAPTVEPEAGTHQGKEQPVTTRPKWQWPQVTDERFRPTDVIYERPDGRYRVLVRDGAPGWNLLARSDKLDSGWSLVAEAEPSARAAQDQAASHEWAVKVVADAPPPGPETLEKLRRLLDMSDESFTGG
jgi:hypothetical protein